MKFPKRIVCLTEETTELLYLLGEQERIVGVTAYTVRPPQAKKEKPVVSAFLDGNIPKILKLKPDLVVGFSDIQAKLAHDLIKHGLNVLITNPRSISEILYAMLLLGNIVGKRKQVEKLINTFQKKIQKFRKQSQKIQHKKKVFFQEWDEPIIPGIQWVSESIEIAGGIDIFADKKNSGLARDRFVSAEEVLVRNPDVILGSWCGKKMDRDWVLNHQIFKKTNAVLKNEIYEIDSSIILQPGPALFLEGIPKLWELLHGNPTYSSK